MSVELGAARTALLMIDLMPRIIERELTPYSGREVLERSLELATAIRDAGGLVVQVRVERDAGPQPEGSGFAPELDPQPGDVQLVKHTIGAFHQTGLDGILREHGIDTVVLCGIATNFGVESTGRAADEHGYRVVFVEDAMTGLDEGAHGFAVGYLFPRFGKVASTSDVVVSIRG